MESCIVIAGITHIQHRKNMRPRRKVDGVEEIVMVSIARLTSLTSNGACDCVPFGSEGAVRGAC